MGRVSEMLQARSAGSFDSCFIAAGLCLVLAAALALKIKTREQLDAQGAALVPAPVGAEGLAPPRSRPSRPGRAGKPARGRDGTPGGRRLILPGTVLYGRYGTKSRAPDRASRAGLHRGGDRADLSRPRSSPGRQLRRLRALGQPPGHPGLRPAGRGLLPGPQHPGPRVRVRLLHPGVSREAPAGHPHRRPRHPGNLSAALSPGVRVGGGDRGVPRLGRGGTRHVPAPLLRPRVLLLFALLLPRGGAGHRPGADRARHAGGGDAQPGDPGRADPAHPPDARVPGHQGARTAGDPEAAARRSRARTARSCSAPASPR